MRYSIPPGIHPQCHLGAEIQHGIQHALTGNPHCHLGAERSEKSRDDESGAVRYKLAEPKIPFAVLIVHAEEKILPVILFILMNLFLLNSG